jgi:hypothetical protein
MVGTQTYLHKLFSSGQDSTTFCQSPTKSKYKEGMRETYLVDRRYLFAVLVRFDCMTNTIPQK